MSHRACEHPIVTPGIRIACSGYHIGKNENSSLVESSIPSVDYILRAGKFCEAKCHSQPGKSSFDIVTKLEMNAGKGNRREPDRKTYVMMCIGNRYE